jgi:hypothetical protein
MSGIFSVGSGKIHIFTLRPLRLCGEFFYRRIAESAEKRLLIKPLRLESLLYLSGGRSNEFFNHGAISAGGWIPGKLLSELAAYGNICTTF